MPEVTDGGRTFTIRIKPGIYFSPDPAFHGKRRELVAADYVYSFKRFADPKVRALYAAEVQAANEHLASFEKIVAWELLPAEFTLETGELTPTQKVKRRVINQKYGDTIEPTSTPLSTRTPSPAGNSKAASLPVDGRKPRSGSSKRSANPKRRLPGFSSPRRPPGRVVAPRKLVDGRSAVSSPPFLSRSPSHSRSCSRST